MKKIAFGGSCHWCTEAIFQSLSGAVKVKQGWVASNDKNTDFSEGVIVYFDENDIDLHTLIAVHLHTHSCTATHPMRGKYRSAIYTFTDDQIVSSKTAMTILQKEFEQPIITEVLPFIEFKLNKEEYLNYYQKNPNKPFCKAYIEPKLSLVLKKFAKNK